MQLVSQLSLLNRYERLQHSLYEYLRRHTIWSGYRKILCNKIKLTNLPFHTSWNTQKEAEVISFLKKYNLPTSSALWHKIYYAATGLYDQRYVCEPFFYDRIETRLSPRSRIGKYFDKNFYERMQLSTQPRVLARLVAGRLTFPDFSSMSVEQLLPQMGNLQEIVVKPALNSGGGNKVQFITRDSLLHRIACMKRQGLQDLVLQEPISQCSELAMFNPDSANTLRIVTLRFKRKIKAISSVLRIGRTGTRVDNWGKGGMSVGINDDGSLKAYAFDQYFMRLEQHPDSGLKFAEHHVPAFGRAVDAVCEKHKYIPDVDLISWDVAIDHNYEPLVVEMNMNLQGINLLQLSNGPLFGELTEEIFEYYQMPRKKSFFAWPIR